MTPPQTHTQHLNRLARESSPYLLQHQHNPVDWYAWGPEAFDTARRENKPIFLSVGYSSCYWCHVMERQSFEQLAVASEMNRLFVNIKVDREERTDVDQLYMTAVQVLTRQGGWPMSVFLTPDLRPFYGGTYFPPTDQYGRPGFTTLLRAIEDAYRNRLSDVEKTAEQLMHILRQMAEPAAAAEPLAVDEALIDSLIERSTADYDFHEGGFGAAPKFPRETLLELLLVYSAASGSGSDADEKKRRPVREMVLHTLDSLARGGIRDHLGGGFHRYSTDARWLVPHFEIMLYDNAMLAWVYAEAFRQTRDPRWSAVARGILDFILREMTSPQGAFYTALDAEVDAREGGPYLWTKQQVETVLRTAGASPHDAALFTRAYGLDAGPNFADPHHGNGIADANVLHLPVALAELAHEQGASANELEARLAPLRQRLYEARRLRKQPMLDTKILTSWNALMIRAFAFAGQVLSEPRYVEAGARAADFLLAHHRTPDGGLFRTSRPDASGNPDAGKPKYKAFLDDYAFFAQALLALHESTGDGKWRGLAAEVAVTMQQKFGDSRVGGLFFTASDAVDLPVRQKTATDSPLPSGNAVAAMALLSLGQPQEARRILGVFAPQVADHGEGMSSMVQAMLLYLRQAPPFAVESASAETFARPVSPQQTAESLVSLSAALQSREELLLRLQIAEGFHINAHEVAGGMPLIPTTLSAVGAAAIVSYPAGREQTFAFSEVPLRVYAGQVEFRVRFDPPARPGEAIRLRLSYQACNDQSCWPAATKELNIAVV